MTFKTTLIAISLIGGFYVFMTVTWDVSEWMLRDGSAVTEKVPAKTESNQSVKGNAAGFDQEAEPQKAETQDASEPEEEQAGTYDDRWSGEVTVKPEADLVNKPPVAATTVQDVGPKSLSTRQFPSDDRENVEPDTSVNTSEALRQYGDPYQADERETN